MLTCTLFEDACIEISQHASIHTLIDLYNVNHQWRRILNTPRIICLLKDNTYLWDSIDEPDELLSLYNSSALIKILLESEKILNHFKDKLKIINTDTNTYDVIIDNFHDLLQKFDESQKFKYMYQKYYDKYCLKYLPPTICAWRALNNHDNIGMMRYAKIPTDIIKNKDHAFQELAFRVKFLRDNNKNGFNILNQFLTSYPPYNAESKLPANISPTEPPSKGQVKGNLPANILLTELSSKGQTPPIEVIETIDKFFYDAMWLMQSPKTEQVPYGYI
jgi:hypothetical protein